MSETAASIFAKIAIEKGFLDEKKLEQARTLQRLARKDGKAVTIDKACLELDLLTPVQVKGLERGLKYYVVRKADKIYGKLAVQKKFADKETVENCLEKQKNEYAKKKLVRLSKLLMGLDAIDEAQDAELRAAVLKRLSPEESHHEATAVSDDDAAEAIETGKAPKGAAKGSAKAESAKIAKKPSIAAPKIGSGRASGERKAAPVKDIDVKRGSKSGRAAAPASSSLDASLVSEAPGLASADPDATLVLPKKSGRASKERKVVSFSSVDETESAPALDAPLRLDDSRKSEDATSDDATVIPPPAPHSSSEPELPAAPRAMEPPAEEVVVGKPGAQRPASEDTIKDDAFGVKVGDSLTGGSAETDEKPDPKKALTFSSDDTTA